MKKLLFIIPDNNPQISNQFLQVLEITEVLKNKIDFFILIEKKYPVFVRPFIILYARIVGYKKAFVYYSYSSLIFAKLAGCQTYFWHCYWQLKPNFLLSICLRITDYLVTGTITMAKKYQDMFKIKNTKIVPSWINLKNFQTPKIWHKQKTILFYPRLTYSKGSDWLPKIIKKLKGYHIEIVNGNVPNNKISERIAASDLYILPSRGEGLPRAVLEVMAVGIPFVTTNIGGINDITTKLQKQCLINFGDTDSFVKKVKEILSDKILYQKLVMDGKRQVKKYDIEYVKNLFYKMLT